MTTKPTPDRAFEEQVHAQLESLVATRREMDDIQPEFAVPITEFHYDLAAEALTKFGERALTPLIAALEDPDTPLRLEAVLALGRLGLPQAVDAIRPFLHGPDAALQLAAIQAIGFAGDARACDALFTALPASPGPRYEAVVASLLSACRPRAVAMLCTQAPALPLPLHEKLVAAVVAEDGPEVVSRLERILGNPATPQGLCTLKALIAAAPERTLPRLWSLLAHDFLIFRDAFEMLRDAHAPGLEAAALQALQHRDSRVRRYAVEFLGRHGDAETVSHLARFLSSEPDAVVRQITLRALGRLGGPAAVDVVLPCIHDADLGIQTAAVEVLGVLGDARACDPLAALLPTTIMRLRDGQRRHDIARLRDAIAIALLSVCRSRSIALLYPQASALDSTARGHLALAIAAEGGPEAADRLERMYHISHSGFDILKALAAVAPERAVPLLLPHLKVRFASAWTFQNVFEILNDIHAPCIETEAVQALQHKKPDVREYGVKFLGVHGAAQTIPLIAQLLFNDPDFRVRAAAAAAVAALAQRTGVDVRPDLTRALSDPHLWVQQRARSVLKQIDNCRISSSDAECG
ncbi:MAG TPA: HEAT repeat domain-containing protein [Anaerolineae bacterium]|nr:HEAT repeat domain-containing protein [Anaerolineae bacterium]